MRKETLRTSSPSSRRSSFFYGPILLIILSLSSFDYRGIINGPVSDSSYRGSVTRGLSRSVFGPLLFVDAATAQGGDATAATTGANTMNTGANTVNVEANFDFTQYGVIEATGYFNSYYQSYEYLGSRVLEHGSVEYKTVRWTQFGDVDNSTGVIYLVDALHHIVISLAPNSTYFPFPTIYMLIAGNYGRKGYFDGIREKSLFNNPQGLSLAPGGIYVADTNNHAIRFLNFAAKAVQRRVITIAGHPDRPGLLDGPAQYASLRYPTNLGNTDGRVFVLDNHNRVRLIIYNHVITLVDGSCRSLRKRQHPMGFIVREVGCHDLWSIRKSGDKAVAFFQHEVFCSGHAGSCAPRHLPALADPHSKNILTLAESKPKAAGDQNARRLMENGNWSNVNGTGNWSNGTHWINLTYYPTAGLGATPGSAGMKQSPLEKSSSASSPTKSVRDFDRVHGQTLYGKKQAYNLAQFTSSFGDQVTSVKALMNGVMDYFLVDKSEKTKKDRSKDESKNEEEGMMYSDDSDIEVMSDGMDHSKTKTFWEEEYHSQDPDTEKKAIKSQLVRDENISQPAVAGPMKRFGGDSTWLADEKMKRLTDRDAKTHQRKGAKPRPKPIPQLMIQNAAAAGMSWSARGNRMGAG